MQKEQVLANAKPCVLQESSSPEGIVRAKSKAGWRGVARPLHSLRGCPNVIKQQAQTPGVTMGRVPWPKSIWELKCRMFTGLINNLHNSQFQFLLVSGGFADWHSGSWAGPKAWGGARLLLTGQVQWLMHLLRCSFEKVTQWEQQQWADSFPITEAKECKLQKLSTWVGIVMMMITIANLY